RIALVTTPDGRAVQCFGNAKVLRMGDTPGHDFHGNQWTGGIGGGGGQGQDIVPAAASPALNMALGKLTPEQLTRFNSLEATIRQAEAEGKDTKTQFTDPATGQYTAERQAEQEKIMNEIKARWTDVPSDHQAIIMGGLGG